MAGLPHFKNSTAGIGRYEPIYLNQYEVIVTPPGAVSSAVGFSNSLTLEHVNKIGPLPELSGNAGGPLQTQRYKFSERAYAAAKPQTTLSHFTIEFSLNLNDNNENYIYNAFRAWGNLIYNPMTGQQGLKRDYAGKDSDAAIIEVRVFNRAGDIFRHFQFSPVFIDSAKFNEWSLDYGNDNLAVLTVPFVADAYIEINTGQFASTQQAAGPRR